MSGTAARIVLRGALAGARVPAEALTARDLPRVLEALESTAGHLVPPTQAGTPRRPSSVGAVRSRGALSE